MIQSFTETVCQTCASLLRSLVHCGTLFQSQDQALRIYHLFEPSLREGSMQTYEILLREVSKQMTRCPITAECLIHSLESS